AMFAVEVQDAQGRYCPLAENQVAFHVSGRARLIGTGNGDPTNHESDGGSARKAFNGLCMALVQSTKDAGEIAVEATPPGLTPAPRIAITSKTVKLRLQVAEWEPENPAGPGITGRWRPESAPAAPGAGSFGGAGGVYTFRQNGN